LHQQKKNDIGDNWMIEECTFKSKVKHGDECGCNLTPERITCPGEDECIFFQTYKNTKK